MVESKQTTYEECRKQRMEENKKRMEELSLNTLAQSLKPSTPVKQVKPRARSSVELSSTPLRRSSRMADKPPPNYKEVPFEPLERIRRNYKGRGLLDRVRASDGVRQYAIKRADKVESELDSQFPTFIKPMLQSHVSGGFWLGLPNNFCKKHLPLEDETITLVDEVGDKSQTKYLADKNGLSGGWRGFAIDHDLEDGDALVFQLVMPTQFKVYIIRAHQSDDEYNEKKEESDEDVNDKRSGKSTGKKRAAQSDDSETEKSNEDIDDKPSGKGRTRKTCAAESDDSKNEKNDEDVDEKPSGKSTRKMRAYQSHDNDDNEKSDEDIDNKPSSKRCRKTRASQSDDNKNGKIEEKNEDIDVATSGRSAKRTRASKK